MGRGRQVKPIWFCRKRVKTTHERFESMALIVASGCWEWQGPLNKPNGYGRFFHDGLSNDYCHIYSYRYHYGPIPEGCEIDHLCNNRRCCNPKHLDAVTHGVNVQRAASRRTVCQKGLHPRTPENLLVSRHNGRQVTTCGPCKEEWRSLRRARLALKQARQEMTA